MFTQEESPGDAESVGMLPLHESDLLMDTIAEAMRLVEKQEFAAGYDLLLGGLRRARTRGKNEPWGAGLLQRWRRACDNYIRSYGVPME